MNVRSFFDIRFLGDKELDAVYLFQAIHAVGMGLSSVFIPIFLWENGYSLSSICLFFALLSFYFILLTRYCIHFLAAHTHRSLLLLATPILALTLALIPHLKVYPYLFVILPLGFAINKFCSDVASSINFAHVTDEGDYGKQIGMQYVILGVVSVLTPISGAFIAYIFGLSSLFFVAIAFMLAALIPIWKLDSRPLLPTLTYKHVKALVRKPEYRYFMFINSGYGANYAIQVILWPLFIFLTVENIAVFGSILSIASFITLLIQYTEGSAIDHGSKKSVTLFSVSSHAIVSGLQALVALIPHVSVVAGAHIAHKITLGALSVPFSEVLTRKTKQERHPGIFVFAYMYVWHIARMLILILLALIALLLPTHVFFFVAFLVGAGIVGTFYLLVRL